MSHLVETEVGGRRFVLESGHLAQQAHGAVTVRYGETVVLVTVCASREPRPGVDFLPLTVDFEERLYAAGKIPGGFIKREGRPTQDAVLAMRMTDRPIRPLFPKGFRNEVQVVISVLSTDMENDHDVLAIIGASAALTLSPIPWAGPVSAVRMGYQDGRYMLNPTFKQLQESELDLVVASTPDAVVMVEAGATGVKEEVVLEAIRLGHEANLTIIRLQRELAQLCGKPKTAFTPASTEGEVEDAVAGMLKERLEEALYTADKGEREDALDVLKRDVVERLGDQLGAPAIRDAVERQTKAMVRRRILEEGIRTDGRAPQTIRPVSCEVGLLPRTHGSGLFNRGQTQVLSILTLGTAGEEQRLDGLSPEEKKRFMHHYNFPPFSTGEVGRMVGPSRRSIGHGALGERALEPVLPDPVEFPYTIRIVSEVLSSNGSTSMASVCGSILAMMDGGVPIREPVAGVAMGLIMGEGGRYAVLTDIAGIEDAMGDMDFKVAGTASGITALQMDVKVKGLSETILRDALEQARIARLAILEKMLGTIGQHRADLSRFAPKIVKIHVNPDKIRTIIGPGGKMIRSITESTKCTIDVEDDGSVFIGSSDPERLEEAIRIIEGLTKEVEIGAIYTGRVTRLTNFGAFVEVLPGKEGLVRIPDLADYPVAAVEDVVQVGDEIMVMCIEIDRMGRVNLSRRAVLEGSTEGSPPAPRPPMPARTGPPPFRQQGPRAPQPGNSTNEGPRGPAPRRRTEPTYTSSLMGNPNPNRGMPDQQPAFDQPPRPRRRPGGGGGGGWRPPQTNIP